MSIQIKRAALFCRDEDKELSAYKLEQLLAYAEANGMVVTVNFSDEQEAIASEQEYDVILHYNERVQIPFAGRVVNVCGV